MTSTNWYRYLSIWYFLNQYLWTYHIHCLPQNPYPPCNISITLALTLGILVNSINTPIVLCLKRSHLDQKHQSIRHIFTILLILKLLAFGYDIIVLPSSISPIIKGACCRIDHLIHRSYCESIKFLIESTLSSHHACDVEVDVVLFGMAVLFVVIGTPVEAYLAASVVENDC